MHWADVEAGSLTDSPLIATGITPSGPIHLGSLREILTGDAIRRAKEGARLIYISDSIDPLRKVYPFLDEGYSEHIGKPLSDIPCPCGEHENYAEHYLEPFLDSIKRLGVECEILHTHEMYARGDYEDAVRRLITYKDEVRKTLTDITGRKLAEDWYPYNPKCSLCGTMGDAEINSFEDPYVHYLCSCGYSGKADIRKDDGKLPWRCDWPARWWILGVDCEPLGKDHAAAGGSWDTGVSIVKNIFGKEPPQPVIYEWIQLKGKGAMASSTGIVVKSEDVLDIVGPEAIRYLLFRYKLNTHIDFDPGLGVLDLVDEYDACEKGYYHGSSEPDDARVYELAQVDGIPDERPNRVPYRHLVNLVQIYDDNNKIWDLVNGSDWTDRDRERLEERITHVKNWLDRFAPEMVKFSICPTLPTVDLSEDEKLFLELYTQSLESRDIWEPEFLHNTVHSVSEECGIKKGKAFSVFYKVLIDKTRGPKLGRLLAQLDREFVLRRLKEAVNHRDD